MASCSSGATAKQEMPSVWHFTKYTHGPGVGSSAAARASGLMAPMGVGVNPRLRYVLYGPGRARSNGLVRSRNPAGWLVVDPDVHVDPRHVEVRTARRAAAAGAALWVLLGIVMLNVAIGPVALVAISLLGLPVTALWMIAMAEAAHRMRLA